MLTQQIRQIHSELFAKGASRRADLFLLAVPLILLSLRKQDKHRYHASQVEKPILKGLKQPGQVQRTYAEQNWASNPCLLVVSPLSLVMSSLLKSGLVGREAVTCLSSLNFLYLFL